MAEAVRGWALAQPARVRADLRLTRARLLRPETTPPVPAAARVGMKVFIGILLTPTRGPGLAAPRPPAGRPAPRGRAHAADLLSTCRPRPRRWRTEQVAAWASAVPGWSDSELFGQFNRVVEDREHLLPPCGGPPRREHRAWAGLEAAERLCYAAGRTPVLGRCCPVYGPSCAALGWLARCTALIRGAPYRLRAVPSRAGSLGRVARRTAVRGCAAYRLAGSRAACGRGAGRAVYGT